jgi:glutathione synthase
MIARNGYSGLEEKADNRYRIEKSNVIVYLDNNALDLEGDSSKYLASALAQDPFFQVTLSTEPDANLAEYANVVIPRFNPPLNEEFTNDLEKYDDGSKLFINCPKALRYFSDKRYLGDIVKDCPEILPRTIVSLDPVELGDFMYDLKKSGKREVIYKPIKGFGGEGIKKISLDRSPAKLYRLALELSKGLYVILQEYIENITNCGDKRIHIVNGNPIGAVLRMPQKGEFRCNVKRGGSKIRTEVTSQDRDIIEKITPLLERQNVYWAGIDIIGPYLGEINVISPGLLYAADELNGLTESRLRKRRSIDNFVNSIKEEIKSRSYKQGFSVNS